VPKTRSPYPAEFRANAVKLLRSSGKTIPELARDLGCSTESLRNWTKQADRDAGRRKDGLTSEEREEFGKLRRQVKVLEEERAILLKAAAFFATETGRTR
jgi:transposase